MPASHSLTPQEVYALNAQEEVFLAMDLGFWQQRERQTELLKRIEGAGMKRFVLE